MDVLIRDLDASTYRSLRARAALEGRPLGDVATDALRAYLARNPAAGDIAHLLDAPEEGTPARQEHNGKPVDEVVYLYCI